MLAFKENSHIFGCQIKGFYSITGFLMNWYSLIYPTGNQYNLREKNWNTI